MTNNCQIQIGGATLQLPTDHTLREICTSHPSYDFIHWNILSSLAIENDLVDIGLIDVGANVGDSVAHFRRKLVGKVVAVEPDEVFYGICKENCGQFEDVCVIDALVCPQTFQGAVSFERILQTGRTYVGTTNLYRGPFVTVGELLKSLEGPLIFKTDTDGFDAQILQDLVDCIEDGQSRVQIISFEGPTEEQIKTQTYNQFLEPIKRIQKLGYRVLILTNLGFPVSFPGQDFSQVEWHLNRLHTEAVYGRASCHYFDFVAIAPELSHTTCRFDTTKVFDDLYTA